MYGFNFQWMTSWAPDRKPEPPNERALDFMAKHGFDFVRIPTDYRFWTREFDYLHPDETLFEYLDTYLQATKSRGMHLSLNFHRAPGYCINGNDLERDNLWLDEIAQDGFAFQWETIARRFQGVSNKDLSFDLVNEPPDLGQYGFTRDRHEKVIRRVVKAIRDVDAERSIVIDGLEGGNLAMPELADLPNTTHSCRGYQPMTISHYKAGWWAPAAAFAEPVYPGGEWNGKVWDRGTINEFYRPWREVEAQGVKVHVGEFGCYDKTPNDVALRWFGDLFSLFKQYGWGYALWGFEGAFGIIDHGRPGVVYETLDGYRVDRALLELMLDCQAARL